MSQADSAYTTNVLSLQPALDERRKKSIGDIPSDEVITKVAWALLTNQTPKGKRKALASIADLRSKAETLRERRVLEMAGQIIVGLR